MINEATEVASTLRSDSCESISILAEQKLGVSIRPKEFRQGVRIELEDLKLGASALRGYLASIFDTLLSSQGADAHHRRPSGRRWGNLSTLDRALRARQLGGEPPSASRVQLSGCTIRTGFHTSSARISVSGSYVLLRFGDRPFLEIEAVRSSPVGRNGDNITDGGWHRQIGCDLGRVALVRRWRYGGIPL